MAIQIDKLTLLCCSFLFWPQKSLCANLGAEVVTDILNFNKVTHYVASDDCKSFARTLKTMAALGTSTYIVVAEWLVDSVKANRVLPVDNYCIPDDVTQGLYGFSLSKTLTSAMSNRPAGLLQGVNLFFCAGTLGISNRAPSKKDMKNLVELFNGNWIGRPKTSWN